MRAIILEGKNQPLVIKQISKPTPGKGEILIQVKYAGLNHRDLWIQKGKYHTTQYPCVLGSDASGIVCETGAEVDPGWLHKAVIINPALYWGDDDHHHGPNFQILGVPSQGTLAEYVCVPATNVHLIPEGWNFARAAALPLAALTAYRALFTRGQLKAGEKCLITGVGGGAANFLLKFALAAKAQVWVTSSRSEKLARAAELGAQTGSLYTKEDWAKKLQEKLPEGFDLIIDSAAGLNFKELPDLLKVGGRMVIFGGTAGLLPEIPAAKIFWKQASILGTTMGSPKDFQQMLALVEEYDIQPDIARIFPMEDAEAAVSYMASQQQFGKIVLEIS